MQPSDVEPIGKATVLHGHVSPETAYLVKDYPHGRAALHCQIRYWVDTSRWGVKRGQRRFVLQTTNPKVPEEPWNKPHPGKYCLLVWMYLDSEDHVHHATFDKYGMTPPQDAWLRLTGIYDQIPAADQEIYDTLLQNAKRNVESWRQWATAIDLIADHLDAAGTPPTLDNGFIIRHGHCVYVGKDDYSLAVAIARRRTA
jgi:hypothetical protein